MTLPDSFLERIFCLSRQAPPKPLPAGAPHGFATRVLAQCHTAEGGRDWVLWLLPRAIGAAGCLAFMLLAFGAVNPAAAEGHELAELMMHFALEVQP